jgi:hypothetical protein
MFAKRITVEREPDSSLNKYEPLVIELKAEEIMTLDQIRFRLKDELNITDTMIALVDGEQVPGTTVLEDGMQIYYKEGMGDKGNDEWMKKYLKPLEGRTIKETGIGENGFPFFVLDNGNKIEVSSDGEGNGPGFLFGLPRPK